MFFICVVLQRDRGSSGVYQRSIKDRGIVVLSSLCLVNSVSPESEAAKVSFRVDTETLGMVFPLPGKTCEELFYQSGPVENPSFSIYFYLENM